MIPAPRPTPSWQQLSADVESAVQRGPEAVASVAVGATALRVVAGTTPPQGPVAWHEGRPARAEAWAGAVLAGPAVLVFAAFMFVPLLLTVWFSLHEWGGFGPLTWVGAGQLRRARP